MKRFTGLAVIGVIVAGAASAGELAATLEGTQVNVSVDGKLFTAYKFADSQKYPYFWPVMGPASGKSVTTETAERYPHHHSLFFGCDHVNSANFWQDTNDRGQILSQGPKIVEAKGDRVVITDECLWRQPGKEPVIRDTRRISVSAPASDYRLIDFEITLDPLVDIRIEKTNHSLFSGRIAPELSVNSSGTLVNAEGAKSEAGTLGVASPWCDYYGTRDGGTEGLAILQHPANKWFPSKWFTRDYGFFSPTPLFWEELLLPKGQPLTLKYRVVVHAGDTQAADIPGKFAEFSKN